MEISDVCVIGAGPAGSTAALELLRMGHRVVVIEKLAFPRAHVGESVASGILPLLAVLNASAVIQEAEFMSPARALVHWPPAKVPFETAPGFQVDRSRFDNALIRLAEKRGVRVMERARIVEMKWLRDRWSIAVQRQGKQHLLECSFLVDARGRHGMRSASKKRYGIPTLALHGYWRSSSPQRSETCIEAGTGEWFWGGPVPDGTFNATVFIDSKGIREQSRKSRSLERLYRELLSRSDLLSNCCKGELVTPVSLCDATCYYDAQPVTEGLIRIGEAAFSVDPLSSQGIVTAIATGIHAAAVTHTIMQSPSSRKIAEQFYRKRQEDTVRFHHAVTGILYAQVALQRGGAFWESRDCKLPATPLRLTRTRRPLQKGMSLSLAHGTRFLQTPCRDGDFIVRRLGVTHPQLGKRAVFVNNVLVAPLLKRLHAPHSVDDILSAWSGDVSRDCALQILHWSWDKGLLVENGP